MAKHILSWIGVLATLATLGSGIYQYGHSKDQEFRRAFWEKRYQLYSDATDLAASIAIAENLASVAEERSKFWQLYYGKMSIVEDRAVYNAMVDFGKKLEPLENSGNTSPELKIFAYGLARACRESLKNTWEPVALDDIPNDRVWDLK